MTTVREDLAKHLTQSQMSSFFIDKMGIISVKSYGAKGDGVTDDTNAIQAAHDAANNGDIIFFPRPSVSYVCNKVNITKRLTIIGAGEDVVITRSSAVNIFYITGTNVNVTFQNITIDGATYKKGGIQCVNVNKLTLDHVTVKRCGIPGYAAGNNGSVDGVYCNNVQVVVANECTFSNNERDGLMGVPIKKLFVTNCILTGNGRYGVVSDKNDLNNNGPELAVYTGNYLDGNGAGGLHVESYSTLGLVRFVMMGNTVIDCGNDDWNYGVGLVAGLQCYGIMANNIIQGFGLLETSADYGSAIIIGSVGGPIKIVDNIITNSRRHGIRVNKPGHPVLVSGNTLSGNGASGADSYDAGNMVIIEANDICNNKQHGIYNNLSSFVIIKGNRIRDNSQEAANTYSAISTRLSGHLIITDNELAGTSHKYGLELDDVAWASNLNFIGNNVPSVGTAWTNFANGTSKGTVKNGVKNFYGTAAPTTGTWIGGDIVYNSAPSAGGKIGWICVTAGTPGTWKAFGAIDA